jgi:8-oxo-dGTP pyrophosphatase MutT (NUDIX family)
MSRPAPWEVLDTELVLDRKWLRVRQERVRTARGVVIDEFHVIEASAWAGVVCVTAERQLVLVEQYRHGHGGPSLELPAGVVEAGEPWLEGARRELREETGFVSDHWRPLWRVRPEPARHAQWVEFFVATGAVRVAEQELDETEDMRIVLRPLGELDAIVDEMVHGMHVGALLLAARRGLLDM